MLQVALMRTATGFQLDTNMPKEEVVYHCRFYGNMFYPYEFKDAYVASGIWPTQNFKEVTHEEFDYFMKNPVVAGKVLALVNGKITPVDI